MTYYETLGVSKTAAQEDIKRTYKLLALKYHPDKPTGDAEKFIDIQEAYEVLSNPEKRSLYDMSLDSDNTILQSMIKKLFDVLKDKIREKFKIPNTIKLPVTLHEIYRGDVKKIKVRVKRSGEDTSITLYVSLIDYARKIIFKNMGDECKQDIVIKLMIQDHDFINIDTVLNVYDLLYESQNISLYEFYNGVKRELTFFPDEDTLHLQTIFKTNKDMVYKFPCKGLPHEHGRGDLYVYFRLTLPDHESIPKDITENILSKYFNGVL